MEKLKINPSQLLKTSAHFFSKCADNYHENKLSRWAARAGLLFAFNLELINALNNNPEGVAAYGILGVLFGTPIFINFIREKIGYYQNKKIK